MGVADVKAGKPARAKKRGAGGVLFPDAFVESVTIQGFKSLKNIPRLPLSSMNVLVGANGSGKSNFLSFFDMLGWMIHRRDLQGYVAVNGGADSLLFDGGGERLSREIRAELTFSAMPVKQAAKAKTKPACGYGFTLARGIDERLFFKRERYRADAAAGEWHNFRANHGETKINDADERAAETIRKAAKGCCHTYHFNDTSHCGQLRLPGDEDDSLILRGDGRNLAPVLLNLRERHRANYEEIARMLREEVPSFHDFDLEPAYGKVKLRWRQKSGKTIIGAHQTSDGTLRFMALVTLTNMPLGMVPNIVLLDEPELGVHPYAMSLLSALIRRLSVNKQVIVATQSSSLVNEFKPENVIVAEHGEDGGAASFKRQSAKKLKHWLEEFRMGELWEANVIGGNP